MLAIYLLVAILGCWFFITGKKHLSIIAFCFILSNGFQFIHSEWLSFKNYDIALVYLFLLLILGTLTDRKFWNVRKDPIAKFILFFIAIYIFEYLLTLANGFEDILPAFKVWRRNLLYLSYFVFRTINIRDIKRSVKIMFSLSVITGVAYYLQFAGINLLGKIDTETGVELKRLLNVPAWFMFYLIYLCTTQEKIKWKVFWILFFLGMLILPMARMRIILFFLCLICYYLFSGKVKLLTKYAIPVTIVLIALAPYLSYRFVKEENISTDFSGILDIRSSDDFENNGTFSFRIAMLMERWEYMMDNPQYLLTGVGFRHEESPNCYNKFNFTLGTYTENYVSEKAQLVSVDITWVGVLMYLGLMGIIFYLYLFYFFIHTFYKQRSNSYILAMFLYMIIIAIGSLTEAIVDNNYQVVMLILLMLGLTYRFNLQKKSI